MKLVILFAVLASLAITAPIATNWTLPPTAKSINLNNSQETSHLLQLLTAGSPSLIELVHDHLALPFDSVFLDVLTAYCWDFSNYQVNVTFSDTLFKLKVELRFAVKHDVTQQLVDARILFEGGA